MKDCGCMDEKYLFFPWHLPESAALHTARRKMSAVVFAGATAPQVGRGGDRVGGGRTRSGAATSRRCARWRVVGKSTAADAESLAKSQKNADTLHDAIAVVLVEPQGPVNVGAVARLCQNFGFHDLRIVDARVSVFADKAHLVAQAEEAVAQGDDARAKALMEKSTTAWTRRGGADEADVVSDAESEATVAKEIGLIHGESFKYSTDASAALLARAFRVGGVEKNIDDCTFVIALTARSRPDTPVLSVRQAAAQAAEHVHRTKGKVALLFGNERTGLETKHLKSVNCTALISTGAEKSSLNLSHAVSVAVHELHVAIEEVAKGDAVNGLHNMTYKPLRLDETPDKRRKQKATTPRVASEKTKLALVDDLLAALDAVELAPPRARPPAGLEISDEWGMRRHEDRNSLGRILGVARGGDDGGNEDSESSSGGEITVADAEVLARLARRVAAARRSVGEKQSVTLSINIDESDAMGNTVGKQSGDHSARAGLLDALALGVAQKYFATENRAHLAGVAFDDLPKENAFGVQNAVSGAVGDKHVSRREMRRLLRT